MEHGRTAEPAGAHRGQRIRLVSRETLPGHPPCDLQPGDEGQVTLVDSLGTVHVRWDRGGEFGLIPGHDFWTVAGDRGQGNDTVGKADGGELRSAAWETVRATASDLAEVVYRFPLPAAEIGAVAGILDQLSRECAEAAGMLRRSEQVGSDVGFRG
jgi:hypothetical protein